MTSHFVRVCSPNCQILSLPREMDPEAQQLLEGKEYDKTGRSCGYACAAAPLGRKTSNDPTCNLVLVEQTLYKANPSSDYVPV